MIRIGLMFAAIPVAFLAGFVMQSVHAFEITMALALVFGLVLRFTVLR